MNHSVRGGADLLARGLLRTVYGIRRRLVATQRPALLARQEGLRFRRTAADWGNDRKRDWVLRRLRQVVRRAYSETEYYRDLLSTAGFDPRADFDFDDFARLPVLERDAVRRAGTALCSAAVPPEQLRRDSTGGSTGEPTVIWTGPEERGWGESAIEHFMRRIGVRAGSPTGLLWGHHLDPVASDRLQDRLRDFADNVRWFDCLRLSPGLLAEHHARLQEWRPTCVIAYAGSLGALAEHVRNTGEQPSYPRRCFVTGAEKLLPHHREAIREVFRRPVHERYGSRDAGMIAFQLHPDRTLTFTVDWANLLVEPETAGGESSILITKLHADGMPMLRYRIGDIGLFPEGSRPGFPALSLLEVSGREADRICLPGGKWVNGVTFPHLMKDYPVSDFQIVQARDLSLTIRVVSGPEFNEAALDQIRNVVEANAPGIPISFEMVDRIPRTKANKWRPVISEATPAGPA